MKWWKIVIASFALLGSGRAELPLKVLHLCFHSGCVDEIEGLARHCNLEITSWNILKLPPYFFDPAIEGGNALYNVNPSRASRVFQKHQEYFNQFDAILVSDTTPLGQIFIQNGWTKPLILWVTNRFDWGCDEGEYYQLMRAASKMPNVFLVASSPFEIFYAKRKEVDLGTRVIKPCASYLKEEHEMRVVDSLKNNQIFVHQRTEEVQASRNPSFIISKMMQELNIPVACYRYHSLHDLTAFKGVLYLPYQWCVLSLFETFRLGIPTFIPSEAFLLKMVKENQYFVEHRELLMRDQLFSLMEWYQPELRKFVIYFDSWDDLQRKATALDYQDVHEKTLAHGRAHTQEMIRRWRELFKEVRTLYGGDSM